MKKCAVMLLCGAMVVSGCSTGAGTGAYAGGSLGSVLGSAIGGIIGGPRGSDIGTIVGMASGAAAGAAVGSAADKKNSEAVQSQANGRERRVISEREMRARRNQRIQREKARQRHQIGQNEVDDDMYFETKKSSKPVVVDPQQESNLDTDIVVDETNSGNDSFELEKEEK